MAASTYSYDGKLWQPCPTTSDGNSFFHSAFGKWSVENREYFDKQTKYKRRFWGAFLTYIQDIGIPFPIKNVLRKCWSSIEKYKNASIEDPNSFEDYILDVMDAKHEVVMEEIPILATLLNVQVVVLSLNEPKPIVIRPDVKLLRGHPKTAKANKAELLCWDGNKFSRLEPLPSKNPDQIISKSGAEVPNKLGSGSQKYTKRGDAGAKGVEYQIGIVTVFLLNAFLQKLKNWKLSTEHEEIEGFDDAVLKWDGGAVSLQAKHRENKSKKITQDELMSTNSKKNDFSLSKYFLDYQKNKKKFGREKVIICTNASVEEKVSKYIKSNNVHRNSKLFYENGNCIYYTFDYGNKDFPSLLNVIKTYYKNNYQNKGVEETVITEDNIKDFLGRLEVYCDYPPKDDIMKVVEVLLSETKRRGLLQGQLSPLELYNKVFSWFKQKHDFYLNETYAKAMFSEICKEIHCRRLEKFDVFFETDFDFQDLHKFHHVTVKGGHLLQEIKVVQTLQKMENNFLYVNLVEDIGELRQAIEAFKLPFYKTLVLAWSETWETSMVNKVNDVTDILNKNHYKDGDKYENKEFILITQSIQTLSSEIKQNCCIVDGRVTFKDFSKKTQTDLLTRNVKFQGNTFTLKDLCGMQEIEWYEKALDADVLERLVKAEEVEVGVQVPCLREDVGRFYINRTFQRTIKSKENFSEESLCNVNEKVIVISDIAGMGKSTVLTTLAGVIKRQQPKLWIIRINLNEYTRILSECVRQNKQSITIEEVLNSVTDTKLKNGLENQLFSMRGKVVLMLDGVDEVSPNYTTLMMGMIIECQKNQHFHSIFVTTRPHLIEVLVSKLNVQPFNLQPLSKDKQIDYFVKYWTHSLKLNKKEAEKCKQYAKELLNKLPSYWSIYTTGHFSAVPQHLQMLAEIFQETNSIGNWQGCQEFVKTDKEKPELPDMDLGRLYEIFIERKRQLFLQRENPSGHPGADLALMNQFQECLVLHRNLALGIILDGSKCNLFRSYKSIPKDNEETVEKICKIGIVQKIGESWQFVHRTFAEYFVAQSIIEELKCRNQNLEFQIFLIEEILIDRNYNVIRAFLNNFLNSVLVELPADIFDRYKSVRSRIRVEQSEKFEVIHRIAREGCIAILRLLLKCIKVETVKDKSVKINEVYPTYGVENSGSVSSNVLEILETLVRKGGVNIKDLIGRTPLFYAVEDNRLEMVKFLVEENNANFREKDEIDFSIPYWAIYDNRQEIVRFFFNKMSKEGLNPNDDIAMYAAAYLGELDVLKELAGRGADLSCRVDRGETPLFAAVRGRQLETVKYLLSQGVDVNVQNSKEILIGDRTALHEAVDCGLIDVVKVLVDCGAELDIEDTWGRTPLCLAAFRGNLDFVKFLVDRGASLCYQNDTNYSRVMEEAINGCQEHIVEFLLGLGVDIMARNKTGRTQLHWAASNGYLAVVKFIMKFDVDVNVKDKKGNTPLHGAANENHKNIFELLIEHGADVNVKNNKGNTPLHYAAYKNHKATFEFLVKHGADVNVKNSKGLTPQDILNSKNN